ncbi:MAG TPA: hypothetical protein VHN37_08845 [Actinomycetota bacterium]|nr:hypothetical protein [Actinomycetota bacterium]
MTRSRSGIPLSGDLALTAALHSLGKVLTDDLPAAAAEALAAGADTPSLRRLAGATTSNAFELEELLGRALGELGIHAVTRERALTAVARHRAQQIVDGEIGPVEGAGMIWRLFDDYPAIVMPFLSLEDMHGYETRPRARRRIEAEIVEEAKSYLAKTADSS